jgi:hypothetical protein
VSRHVSALSQGGSDGSISDTPLDCNEAPTDVDVRYHGAGDDVDNPSSEARSGRRSTPTTSTPSRESRRRTRTSSFPAPSSLRSSRSVQSPPPLQTPSFTCSVSPPHHCPLTPPVSSSHNLLLGSGQLPLPPPKHHAQRPPQRPCRPPRAVYIAVQGPPGSDGRGGRGAEGQAGKCDGGRVGDRGRQAGEESCVVGIDGPYCQSG